MIYQRIKDLCKQKGLTVTGLEKELGFSRGSLIKIDKSTPSVDRLQKIADRLGVTPDFLMHGKESEMYYINEETSKVAQAVFDNPNLKALFDAAQGVSPESLKLAAEMLRKMKETNPDG